MHTPPVSTHQATLDRATLVECVLIHLPTAGYLAVRRFIRNAPSTLSHNEREALVFAVAIFSRRGRVKRG